MAIAVLMSAQVSFTAVIDKMILKITPKNSLSYNMAYTLTIPISAVKDSNGNNLKNKFIMNFDTEGKPGKLENIDEASEETNKL